MNRAGEVALVRREDGRLALPEVPSWEGEVWNFDRAVSQEVGNGRAIPEPLRTPLTHLTPLSWGGDGVAVVTLAEARGDNVDAHAWWSLGSEFPYGMPAAAALALDAAARQAAASLAAGRHSGSGRSAGGRAARSRATSRATGGPAPWPFFCLPGATTAIAAALDRDSIASRSASLEARQGDGVRDERSLDQVQGWALSSVWRNDEVVLKVTNPAWQAEARVTDALARIAPANVPAVISQGAVVGGFGAPSAYFVQRRVVDREEDATEDRLAKSARSAAALVALAEVQRACSGNEEALAAAGVIDRRPAPTSEQLKRLWAAVAVELSDSERASLPEIDRKLRAGLEQLSAEPQVVVHGDLHLGNVLGSEDGEPQLIDWTDAAFAWPGVDLFLLLARLEMDDAIREQLIDTYVTALGPRFEKGVRLGLDLAPVYHALSYLRIREFLPSETVGPFHNEVIRLVRHQLQVFDR